MTDELKGKAFVEQAKQYARDRMNHSLVPELFSAAVFEQRLVELIVRDCLKQLETGDLDFAIWKIKKDYGVE
jgi:hypothetical protein